MEANDESEEYEYFHQTIGSHLNLVRQYLTSSNINSFMGNVDFLEKYIMRKPTYILLTSIFILFFFCQTSNFWLNAFSNRLPFKLISKHLKNNLGCQEDIIHTINKLKANQIGIYATQGRRPKMEDKFSFKLDKLNYECRLKEENLEDNKKKNLNNFGTEMIAIYDGHGGDTVSNYLQKNLLSSIKQTLDDYILNEKINKCSSNALLNQTEELNVENVSRILTEQTLKLDETLCGQLKSNGDIAGATAIIAIRLIKTNELIVANIGDSRGVLCDNKGNAIALSFDHKPNHPKEWKRIYQVGGFVRYNGVWRVAGILATSRALGDYPLKEKNYVIANPDILTFSLNELKPKFAIFASDGLWDTFSNEAAIKFVRENLEKLLKTKFKFSKNELSYELAKRLTIEAYKKGSLDNITVAVWLFDFDPIETITKKTVNIVPKVKKILTMHELNNNSHKLNFTKKIEIEKQFNKTDSKHELSVTVKTKEIVNFQPIEYINVASFLENKENLQKSRRNEIFTLDKTCEIKNVLEIEKNKNTKQKPEQCDKKLKKTISIEENICTRLKDEYNIIKLDTSNKSITTTIAESDEEFFDVNES